MAFVACAQSDPAVIHDESSEWRVTWELDGTKANVD